MYSCSCAVQGLHYHVSPRKKTCGIIPISISALNFVRLLSVLVIPSQIILSVVDPLHIFNFEIRNMHRTEFPPQQFVQTVKKPHDEFT